MADARSHAGEFENPDGAESITDVASLPSIIPARRMAKVERLAPACQLTRAFKSQKRGGHEEAEVSICVVLYCDNVYRGLWIVFEEEQQQQQQRQQYQWCFR
jgi:hypothetical protein